MIETLLYYLSFPFVQNALIVGILIALSSSLLGVTLVLKRFSYIGDGLSHVAFFAMAIAAIARVSNNMLIILPITIISAVFIIKMSNKNKRGDSVIAMMSVSSMALGYLLLNIFSASSNISGDVCTTLFGATTILTLSRVDVIISIILSFVVILFYITNYKIIFSITFDEEFAISNGINVSLFHTLISVITAVVVVLAMNLVGSLLVAALIIFPAISSMKFTNSFKNVIIISGILAILSAFIGIVIAILFSIPVGSSIVLINICFFILFSLISVIREGK